MSAQTLKNRLYAIARQGLADANRANPFWSRSEALRALNAARHL